MKKKCKILNAIIMFFLLAENTFAQGNFADSTIATGTKKLIEDLTVWALIIAPIAGGICLSYFFIRRSAADEQDHKKWQNRINVAIISTVGATLASAIINLVTGYYTT